MSVSEVRERHVAVLVILHEQKPWQEPAKDASVRVILRGPIASQELARDVWGRESQHGVVVSGVWYA